MSNIGETNEINNSYIQLSQLVIFLFCYKMKGDESIFILINTVGQLGIYTLDKVWFGLTPGGCLLFLFFVALEINDN